MKKKNEVSKQWLKINSKILYFLGWYLLWWLILSRFRVVRELVGQLTEPTDKKEATVENKSKTKKVRRE